MAKTTSKAVLLVLTLAFAAACSKNDSKNDSKPAPAPGSEVFTIQAKPGTNSNSVLGLWEVHIKGDSNGSLQSRMRIEQSRVTGTMKCQASPTETIYVSVSAAANVDEKNQTIDILEQVDKEVKTADGKGSCSYHFEKTQFKYKLEKGQLQVLSPQGEWTLVADSKITD